MKDYKLTCAQDWVQYFDRLFQTVEIDNFLEFGLGVGTEFLCDHAKNVTSVELSTGDYNLEWTNQTKEQLKDYTNWTLHYVQIPDEIQKSNQDAINNQYPLEDLSYLPVLENIVVPFMEEREYDVIFVDPGIHNRGDIVNFAFGHAPIIAAHDSDRTGRVIPFVYGYNIVKVPENYTEIHREDTYCGTTFWVDHTMEGSDTLIDVLSN
jgi:hypothetical protein